MSLNGLGYALRGFVPTAMELDQRKDVKARLDKTDAENTRRFDLQEGRAAAAEGRTVKAAADADARREFTKNEVGGIAAFAKQQQLINAKLQGGASPDDMVGHVAQAYNTFLRDGRTAVVDPTTKMVNFHGQDGRVLQSVTNEQAVKMMFSPELGEQAKQEAYARIMANGDPAVAAALFSMDDRTATRKQTGQIASDKNRLEERLAGDRNKTSVQVANIGEAGANARNSATNAARIAARGVLTPTQERTNAEIDAAREAVAGMSPQDIMRRTAKATNTGRENPDYDPGLARQAALANRRKVGDDESFDQPRPAAPAFDRADVAKRFRADRTMDNRTLGKETANGIEVMEKGKLIGYFQ